MSQPVLGYWAIRGVAQHIRLLLKYIGVDFEDKQYEFREIEDPSDWMGMCASWYTEKFTLGLEFPNLPYWIHGDVKLTESTVILKYIATVYGKNLVPEGVLEEARAEMVLGNVNDLHRGLINYVYGMKFPVVITIEEQVAKPVEILADFLGSKEWILGENMSARFYSGGGYCIRALGRLGDHLMNVMISYVDFFVYEVLKQYTKFRPDFFKAQPKLNAYITKFETLPELKEYIASTDHVLCYSPFAIHKM